MREPSSSSLWKIPYTQSFIMVKRKTSDMEPKACTFVSSGLYLVFNLMYRVDIKGLAPLFLESTKLFCFF